MRGLDRPDVDPEAHVAADALILHGVAPETEAGTIIAGVTAVQDLP